MFRLFTTVAASFPLAVARGGATTTARSLFSRTGIALMPRGGGQEFETLSEPAPGSPFHYAFPVHDLKVAKDFYGNVLGCVEGRSSEKVRKDESHTCMSVSTNFLHCFCSVLFL